MRTSGILFNDGPSALKSKGTMSKKYVHVSFLFDDNIFVPITALRIIINLPLYMHVLGYLNDSISHSTYIVCRPLLDHTYNM